MDNFQHWKTKIDANNIFWACIGRCDSSVNTLNQAVMKEFETILSKVKNDQKLTGFIITSEKESGFIAGADINAFSSFSTEQLAYDAVKYGQELFNQLEQLACPTLALISKGFCLGGGLELALACDYRIAQDSIDTRLGLPEIKLGIHPGWGGSVRLPRLIGPFKAFDLILSGRTVTAFSALKMGIVDAIVPKRQLENAAQYFIQHKPRIRKASWKEAWPNNFLARRMIGDFLKKKVSKKVKQIHYPAPFSVVDNWIQEGVNKKDALEKEARSFSQLFLTDTAKNLLRVFHLQNRLKKSSNETEFVCKHVHVVGAGTMGADIASWCVLKGLKVTIEDTAAQLISPAVKRAYALFQKKLKSQRLVQAAMDRFIPDIEGSGCAKADIIIEAIIENNEAKIEVFQKISSRAKKGAILATNTSSIPLKEINMALDDPHRLVGIHFFNPVAMMQLVEIVEGEQTEKEVFQKAAAFVHQINRLPLPVKSKPGFLINRILMPYLMESVALLDEGYRAEHIDHVAENFGMPMGPIELADTVGLDVCFSVANNLIAHFGGSVPKRLEELVKNKHYGRKTGKGFYLYKNKKPVKERLVDHEINTHDRDLIDRLIMRMVNEAGACLHEGVVKDADLLDAGMVFGTGFAPFRGGLAHYAKTFAQGSLEEKFNMLEKAYGERYRMNPGVKEFLP